MRVFGTSASSGGKAGPDCIPKASKWHLNKLAVSRVKGLGETMGDEDHYRSWREKGP